MKRRKGNNNSSRQDRAAISLVLLLSEPRFLDAKLLARLVEKAWRPDAITVDGKSPLLTIHADGRTFIIQNIDTPYFDQPLKVAAEMRELRLRKVVAEHRAWLSVEYVESKQPENPKRLYQLIGRLIAELCDSDCLAVLEPATGAINVYDDEIREGLCEKDPAELLNNFIHAPVVNVSPADPRMRQAVAEAKKRWPEFVNAFERRSSGQHFSIRAPFGDGKHTEFMWVGVTAIENDMIYGKLGNEPVHVRGMNAGETVKVRLGDMNDWMFTEGKAMRGGFTIEAIRQTERPE
ncbi:MAG TPA: DUF2314 domain-containing protein [Tepidisphaeraceae bacterium]|jgi:uncharacterized protein YegJ (DUF2314 family)|nr:DUF2314 domain-containing protein [Tepidisphaeraceae bacterium]